MHHHAVIIVVVQSLSCVRLFAAPWSVAHQASLSLTISQSLRKFTFMASVMPSSHLILWCPLFLLLSIFSNIRDFSNESSVHVRWPKYWSFSFSISPSIVNIQGWSHLKLTGLVSLLSKGPSGVFSSTTVPGLQFFVTLPSLQSSSHNHMWPLGRSFPWLYGPLLAE